MLTIIYDNGYWWVLKSIGRAGPFASKQAARNWLMEQEAA